MFLLYYRPLLVSLLIWNKPRIIAMAQQTLLDLYPSGSLLLFPTTLLAAPSQPPCWLWTHSMIPAQRFCTGCSHHLKYLSTHMCTVCTLTSFRSPNKFLLIREIPKTVPSPPGYCLSPYLDLFFS